jgi:predicted kinase
VTVTLTVTCGLPASGKSTWAKSNARGALVLTADAIRDGAKAAGTMIALEVRAREALAQGRNVVIDTCAVWESHRTRYLRIGRDYRARCVIVVFNVDVFTCKARDAKRPNPTRGYDWKAAETHRRHALRVVYAEGWTEIVKVEARHG